MHPRLKRSGRLAPICVPRGNYSAFYGKCQGVACYVLYLQRLRDLARASSFP